MQILLAGVNHRTAPLEVRERLVFSAEAAAASARQLREGLGFNEAVVVSTCNRSELYAVAPATHSRAADALAAHFAAFHGMDESLVARCLYRQHDRETVRHLYHVAAGLDSMLLGEAEILGQVREAYLRAADHRTTGPVLNRLFQGALEVGKRVRAETELGTRPMSVAFAGVKLAEQIFGKLRKHTALIVGAGSVGEQVVEHLRGRGIARLLVANRSQERATELAGRFQAQPVDWRNLEDALVEPDVVVASVSAEEAVLSRGLLERVMAARQNRAMFLIDLGMPRNVEPASTDLYNLYLYNVDDLSGIVEENRRAREREIPRAEALVEEHVGKFESWQAGMQVAALLEELRAKLQNEREEFLFERREEIRTLSADDRERFGTLAEELLDQIVQGSPRRLRHRPVPLKSHEVEAVRQVLGLAREKL